jgi:hypothetical protein
MIVCSCSIKVCQFKFSNGVFRDVDPHSGVRKLWVDKYKPRNRHELIGNQQSV